MNWWSSAHIELTTHEGICFSKSTLRHCRRNRMMREQRNECVNMNDTIFRFGWFIISYVSCVHKSKCIELVSASADPYERNRCLNATHTQTHTPGKWNSEIYFWIIIAQFASPLALLLPLIVYSLAAEQWKLFSLRFTYRKLWMHQCKWFIQNDRANLRNKRNKFHLQIA